MKTHVEMLKEMGVSTQDAEQYISHLEATLPKFGIADSKLRLAHFFAQVLHESGCMRFDMENLNYSADALRKVFGKYLPTEEDAAACARQPERIANRVYANRMGNRAEASGDGWKYRGRGLIQLTGRQNYRAFAEWVGDQRVLDDRTWFQRVHGPFGRVLLGQERPEQARRQGRRRGADQEDQRRRERPGASPGAAEQGERPARHARSRLRCVKCMPAARRQSSCRLDRSRP